MSRLSTPSALFRKSALLATALGFAAMGSMMPAAAKSSSFANLSAREPSISAAPISSAHSVSTMANLPARVFQPTSTGAGHSVSQISRLPARILEPTTTGSGHSVSQISHLPPRILEPTTPGAGQKITGTAQLPPNRIQQTIPSGPTGGIDNICPYNKFKCPPHNPPGGGGNPPPSTQNPGSNPSMPGGYPTGGMGPVVISAPPVVVAAPGGVIAATAPVATTTAATAATATTTAAAAEPCNCLTKQYLDDGSVLFRDLCTKEAALATPAELKAQADASVAR